MGCNCGSKKLSLERVINVATRFSRQESIIVVVYCFNDEYRFTPEKYYTGTEEGILFRTKKNA